MLCSGENKDYINVGPEIFCFRVMANEKCFLPNRKMRLYQNSWNTNCYDKMGVFMIRGLKMGARKV